MPNIYLSPSTQEFNPYVIGGNEESYMNRLADNMVPFLNSSGVRFSRNTPNMTVTEVIEDSNRGNYELHLALHSNASQDGTRRGCEVFYPRGGVGSRRCAEIIAGNMKSIYPLPSNVFALVTTTLVEVTRTRAPAVLVEIAYHDNFDDATWISENLPLIAQTLSNSVCQYFGIPLVTPQPPANGTVITQAMSLNIRARPDLNSAVLARAPSGATLQVLGRYSNWYVVNFQGVIGYASADYIRLN